MRRLLPLVVFLLCLCSCKDKANTFILEGNVAGLANDTLYIYGADALYEHIDTVVAKEGAFRYTVAVRFLSANTISRCMLGTSTHIGVTVSTVAV